MRTRYCLIATAAPRRPQFEQRKRLAIGAMRASSPQRLTSSARSSAVRRLHPVQLNIRP